MAEKESIGTVISSLNGPSPSEVDFVVTKGTVHRGQFVELEYSEGTMVCMVTNVVKTNRYFERADAVKEFEASGKKLFEQFPAGEWEYLMAQTRPLGVFDQGRQKRPSFPPSPGTGVRVASKELLKPFLGFEDNGLHLGEVEYHDLPVTINLSRLIKKHLAVLAMSGAGKCLMPSAEILLEDGRQMPIGKLVDEQLQNGFDVEDGIEVARPSTPFSVMSFSQDNQFVNSPVLAVMRRKAPQQMVRVLTRTGRILEATKEHLIPILREQIEWIPAELLSEKDFVLVPRLSFEGKNAQIDFFDSLKDSNKVFIREKMVLDLLKKKAQHVGYEKIAKEMNVSSRLVYQWVSRSIPIFAAVRLCAILSMDISEIKSNLIWLETKQHKNKRIPVFVECNSEFSRLLAYWLAEGHNCDTYISFVNQNEKIRQDYIDLLEKFFGEKITFYQNNGTELRFSNQFLSRSLKKIGFTGHSKKKFVPPQVLNASKPVISAFLGAFLDCDGFVAMDKPEIEVTLASKEMVGNIDFLFWRLGSIGIRKVKHVKGTPYFRLFVRGANQLADLNKQLNLLIDYKKSRLHRHALKKSNTNIDTIPNTHGHIRRLLELLQMSQPQKTSSGIINYLNRNDNPSKESLQNLLNTFSNRIKEIEQVTKKETFNPNEILSLCHTLNISSQQLMLEQGMHKRALYEYATGARNVPVERFEVIENSFKHKVGVLEQNLLEAKQRASFLQSLLDSNLFFDPIAKIEIVKPDFEFVYDLSVEQHNFIANRMVVHNSVTMKVLIEELLKRSKDQGRIGIVVMDPHGEYTNFAEAAPKTGKDYSRYATVVNGRDIRIGVPKLNVGLIASIVSGLSAPQKRELEQILSALKAEMKSGMGPFDLDTVKKAILQNKEIKEQTSKVLLSWIMVLEDLHLFSKTDLPSIVDLVKPGKVTIVDLSDITEMRKKQILVSYSAKKLFEARQKKQVPPFLLVIEEAHQFVPQVTKEENAISRKIIETIAREGRKFGAALCLVSQRPVNLSTTALANCNTHIILRVTNPYDLKHIGESSEGIDAQSERMITSLRVGEALIVGEAVNFPVFVKIRKNDSPDSKHEVTLEQSARDFEENKEKAESETEEFL